MTNNCPKGMIKRKGYTSKRGTTNIKVPASCIKATSYKGVKRSSLDKKKIARREKIQKRIGKKYGSKKCATGKIEKAGYTRKEYSRKSFKRKDGTIVRATNVRKSEVPPICVKDTGRPGKGMKLPIVLERGDLKKYGYENIKNLSAQERHRALRKANNSINNPLSVFRKLNVLATMNKNRDNDLSKIFKEDALWIREKFNFNKNQAMGSRTNSSRTGSKTSKSKTSKPKSKTSKSKTSKSKTSKPKSKTSKPKSKTSKSKTSKPKSKTSKSKTSKPNSRYGSKRNYNYKK